LEKPDLRRTLFDCSVESQLGELQNALWSHSTTQAGYVALAWTGAFTWTFPQLGEKDSVERNPGFFQPILWQHVSVEETALALRTLETDMR